MLKRHFKFNSTFKSRFARNPHTAILDTQMWQNGFFFRNLLEKHVMEKFSVLGSRVDPYKNRPFH
jgi:hypothetical protein